MELAEQLRIKIMKQVTRHQDRKIKVTASFGVAQLCQDETDMNTLIKDADNMLYQAKLNGRNRVMPGLIKILSGGKEAVSSQVKLL